MTYTEAKAIIKHYRNMLSNGGDNDRQMLRTILQQADELERLRMIADMFDMLATINGQTRQKLADSELRYAREHAALMDATAKLSAVPVAAIRACLDRPCGSEIEEVCEWLNSLKASPNTDDPNPFYDPHTAPPILDQCRCALEGDIKRQNAHHAMTGE